MQNAPLLYALHAKRAFRRSDFLYIDALLRGGDALALEVEILAARSGGAVYINIVYAVERGKAQVVGVEHLDIGAVAVLVRTVHEGHHAEVALVPRFGNGSREALAVSIALPLNGFAQRGRERNAVHVVVYLRAAARLLADGFHGIFHQLHGEVGFGIEERLSRPLRSPLTVAVSVRVAASKAALMSTLTNAGVSAQ